MRLIEEVRNDNITCVINLLNHKIGPNLTDCNNDTPLIWASYHNNFALVEILLRYKADPNVCGYKNSPALHQIYLNHDYDHDYNRAPKIVDFIKLLINYNADINICDKYGTSLLMKACKYNDIETVKLLLSLKVNTCTRNITGNTALLLACFHGYSEQITLLLNNGADFNDLHTAAQLQERDDKLNIINKFINEHHQKIASIMIDLIHIHHITEKGVIYIVARYV